MADVNIKATLSVESGNSAKSINDLKSELLTTKKNLDSAKIGSDEFKKAQVDLAKQQKELVNATKSVNEASSGLTGTFGKLKDGLGGMVPGFSAASKGANGLILKMWEIVANPVGAIIAAIVISVKFLYEAFQSSVAGGKELKAVFGAVSAVGEQVKDAIFGLARAFINVVAAAGKFIALDFKGAAASMKEANREASNSTKQLGDAVDGTTAKIIYSLEKRQQANDKARKLQAVTQSETNKLLVQSRETLTDETASYAEKTKALNEVTKAERASSAEKVRIAAEDLKIAQARAKAMGGEAEKKMKQELRELTISLNEAETENAQTGVKLNKQRKMLNAQQNADSKAAQSERDAQAKEAEAKKKEQDDAYFKGIVDKRKTEDAELAAMDAAGKALETQDATDKETARQADVDKQVEQGKTLETQVQARDQLDKVASENKKKRQNELATLEDNAIKLFGKNSAVGKGIALKNAIINTKEGITTALAAKSTLPSPLDVIAKIANVAVVAKTGYDAVKGILAVNVPGGGGGSAPATPTASAPVAPTQAATNLTASSIQGIGNAATGGTSRAYVLDSDIKDNEERNARINRAARII